MNNISKWIREYAKEKNLVVGVSGGIDSAVTSTLCAETGLPTFAVNISINSHPDSQMLAGDHIEWLLDKYDNVHCIYIDLADTFKQFQLDLPINDALSLANTKSRLRMIALYCVATINNGLVVGTGNKVEDFGVGFFTKYGDGGVDISPIANLYKTEVRELARKLGILEEIIQAKPTDGLWDDGRTDEDQIGVSYEELEKVMKGISTNTKAIEVYKHFHNKNKHKMVEIPVYKGEL